MEVGAGGGGGGSLKHFLFRTALLPMRLSPWAVGTQNAPTPQQRGAASPLPLTASTPLVRVPEADAAPQGLSPDQPGPSQKKVS